MTAQDTPKYVKDTANRFKKISVGWYDGSHVGKQLNYHQGSSFVIQWKLFKLIWLFTPKPQMTWNLVGKHDILFYLSYENLGAIEHSENRIITQSGPFENEAGPGLLHSDVQKNTFCKKTKGTKLTLLGVLWFSLNRQLRKRWQTRCGLTFM